MQVFGRTIIAGIICAGAAFSLQANAAIVPAYDSTGPEFLVGDGIGIDLFTISTGRIGETVALRARNRDDGNPVSVSGNVYTIDAGLSQKAQPGNPQLQFEFQFTSGPEPDSDYWLEIAVDFDPTAGTNFATLGAPVFFDAGAFNWGALPNDSCVNSGALATCTWAGDSETSVWAVANSWNLGFGFWADLNPIAADYDPFATGIYDISLTAFEYSAPDMQALPADGGQLSEQEIFAAIAAGKGNQVVSTRIQAQVVPAPGAVGLIVLGLAALGWTRRKHL